MSLPKNRLVLEIVTHYALTHAPISFAELKRIFPDELQGGTFGVFAPLDAAHPDNFKGYKRYMLNENEVIQLVDGPVAVCNQWRKDNIEIFIACAEKLGYIISSTE